MTEFTDNTIEKQGKQEFDILHDWAVQTRAAKIQQKNALQEQLRGLGIEIAALDKIINVNL